MKLNNHFYVFILCCVTLSFFNSCGKEEKASTPEPSVEALSPETVAQLLPETTAFGKFHYKYHRKTGGRKPHPGAYVQYHYQLSKDGVVSQSSFGASQAPIGILPTDDEIKKQPTPLLEGLRLMSVGDSITISTVGTTFKGDYTYELVLVGILN